MKLLKTMIQLNLNKKDKYILACSYGPDSMCLFDLLLKGNYAFEIAHVNYHLREEEPLEMEDMKKICNEKNIKLHIIDVHMPEGANEEGWAREVRYDYFDELAKKLNIFNVLIAHNEDDLIETYYLQLKRNNIVSYYGLSENTKYKNINIIRPLLSYKKSYLQKYCDDNKVHYGIDWSNYDVSYERNDIRKNIVSLMNESDRKKVLLKIKKLNIENENKKSEILKLSEERGGFFAKRVNKLSVKDMQLLLISLLEKRGVYHPISRAFASEFLNIMKTNKNWHLELDENVYLCVDYGYVDIYVLKTKNYEFKIDEIEPYFSLNKQSDLYEKIIKEGFKIKCNIKTNETTTLVNGVKKKIGRCFIDWKVPYIYRILWPGIYDKFGNLIYVPRYQANIKNEEKSPLKFDLKIFLK
jgi:tRNA(Ile)-lysidine synthase